MEEIKSLIQIKQMKNTVDKLHNFIVKIVTLLEHELEEINLEKSKDALKTKQNIIDALNKLVTLISKLNKLSKDDDIEDLQMSDTDEEIIKNFLEKYQNGQK